MGSIPVAEVMALDLLSENTDAITVDSIDPLHREQPIPQKVGDMVAEWNWRLTAKQPGSWNLQLKAYIRLLNQNVPIQEVTAMTEVDAIEIDLDPGQAGRIFIGNYWQWLVSVIVLPVIVFLGGLFWKRLRRPSSSPK